MWLREGTGAEGLSLQSRASSVGFALLLTIIAISQCELPVQVAVVVPGMLAIVLNSLFFIPGKSRQISVLDGVVVAVTAATWFVVCFRGMHYSGGLSLAFAGAVVFIKSPRKTLLGAVLVSLMVFPTLTSPRLDVMLRIEYTAMQVGLFSLLIFTFIATAYRWRLFEEESYARRTAASLATAQERARVAQDLHDIQGHTLHMVNFKLAAAQVLLKSNPAQVYEELAEAQLMVTDAIRQSKDLAFDRHAVQLNQEVANADRLFEAAGINCEVKFHNSPRPQFETLTAHVIREGTTNILRHSSATRVTIDVSEQSVSITNDGAISPSSFVEHRGGIEGLKQGFRAAGGKFSASQAEDGTFTVEGHFSPERKNLR